MRKIDPVRHEQKRREILQAAWRCFLRNGLGASTAEICAEAVISPGHLYHYFESKDAIVAALATAKLDEATERIKRSITAGVPALDTILSEVGQLTDSRRRAEFALLFEMLAESARTPAMARLLQDSSPTGAQAACDRAAAWPSVRGDRPDRRAGAGRIGADWRDGCAKGDEAACARSRRVERRGTI